MYDDPFDTKQEPQIVVGAQGIQVKLPIADHVHFDALAGFQIADVYRFADSVEHDGVSRAEASRDLGRNIDPGFDQQ